MCIRDSTSAGAKVRKAFGITGRVMLTLFLIGLITGTIVVGAFAFYVFRYVDGSVDFDLNNLTLDATTIIYADVYKRQDIMYDSTLAYVNTSDGSIESVVLATKKGLIEIKAKLFIDCTGDAILSDFAGATVFTGEDGVNQRTSLRFEMSGVDGDRLGEYLKEGGQSYSNTRENIYIDHGTCPARCV